MTVVFLLLDPRPDAIIGVMSLIIWTMTILVSLQYTWLAMSLSIRGEGGTIVLREVLTSLITSRKKTALVTILSFIGVSLLMGDGVITPAISILSAVEGSSLIPGLEHISRETIMLIAIVIAVCLFSIQKKGAEKVAFSFGPIMSAWFLSLAAVGVISIIETPRVLLAVNPYYGVRFLLENGWKGYLALGEIILCATGGEALFADMGHLGAKPIRQAWGGVFVALVINYLGQGAFLLRHPEAKNILFEMVFHYSENLYIPFLLLSISATVIASQAMISGIFSIIYQAITTRIMPMFKVDYTSVERKSQIYISSANWFLLTAVVFVILLFQKSSSLAAAYGLAVTGDMTITGFLTIAIFLSKKKPHFAGIAFFVTCVDLLYLFANLYKIPHGGYWSLVLASIPLCMIFIYTQGQKRLYKMISFMPLEDFSHKFQRVYTTTPKINGTALFLVKDIKEIPAYVIQIMFFHGIMYEDNIFFSILKRNDPFGVIGFFKEDIAPGLRVFEIQMGYMEHVEVEEILKEAGIDERAVFYGLEDITSGNIIWKVFSLLKRITPPFIQFFKFPHKRLLGVLTKVEL